MAVSPDVSAIRRLVAVAHMDKPKWFTRPVILGLLAVPLLLSFGVRGQDVPAVLVAYANLVVIGVALISFARCRTLEALVPVFFLAWFAVGFPLTSIYVAIFQTNAFYEATYYRRYLLDGNLRIQVALFLFLMSYLAVVCPFAPGGTPYRLDVRSPRTRRMAVLLFWIATLAIAYNAVTRVIKVPFFWDYLANALHRYLRGLFFILGATFIDLPVLTRFLGGAVLIGVAVFYSIGNAREFAMWPAVLLTAGLLFVGRAKPKTKVKLVLAFVLLFPTFLVIANTTRAVLGTVGYGDIEARLRALRQWKETLEGSVAGKALGRLFSTGGHSLITLTPEQYGYLDFSFEEYGREFLTRMLPGVLYYKPHYTTTGLLIRYGFYITEKNSTELSMLGSLWMLGGYVPVIIGGFGVGVAHVLLIRVIRVAARQSAFKAIFYFCLVAPWIIWAHNMDPISHVRSLIWQMGFSIVIYSVLVGPLLGPQAPVAPAPAVPVPAPVPQPRRG